MKKALFIVLSLLLFLYLIFLFLLPGILNSNYILKKLQSKYNFEIKNYKFKTNPNLDITLDLEKLNHKNALRLDNAKITYNLLSRKTKDIEIDYIFYNINLSSKNKKTKKSFNFNNLKNTHIKNALIVIDNNQKINFYISNFKTITVNKTLRAYFNCEIKSKILKYTPTTGKKGSLVLDNYNLKADNLEIVMNNSSLFLNGDIINKSGYKLNVSAKNFPIGDCERLALYFMKIKKPKKHFLENFKNFDGTMNVNLTFCNKTVKGLIDATNLSGDTVMYNIPIIFKKARFNFLGKKITSNNPATFGGEKAALELNYDNLFTDNLIIYGNVKGHLLQRFSKKYAREYQILNYIDIVLNFYNKHQKPDVNYSIKFDKECNLSYKNFSLNSLDKKREVYIETHKEPDFLKIKKYSYYEFINNSREEIFSGEAFFKRKNKKMKPQYITIKTNRFVPILYKNIYKGSFKGNLKYDFNLEKITGNFILNNIQYNDLYFKSAQIIANDKLLNLSARGKYSTFPCYFILKAKNDSYKKDIYIYNAYLFLDKYIIKKRQKHASKKSKNKKDITIDNWEIRLNEVSYDKIKIYNILSTGNLKNNIVNYSFNNAFFAKGTIQSKGNYNIKNNDVNLVIKASELDLSNIANSINVKNQIKGTLNIDLEANIKNNFKNIKTNTNFRIYNTKLLKYKNKTLLSKIINFSNIDIAKEINANTKASFNIKNNVINDIDIKIKHKTLSAFLEGCYDKNKQCVNLNLWVRMDKKLPEEIKVFFIPLNWIIKFAFKPEKIIEKSNSKILQIPDVITNKNNQTFLKIKIFGNINKNNTNLELRRMIK